MVSGPAARGSSALLFAGGRRFSPTPGRAAALLDERDERARPPSPRAPRQRLVRGVRPDHGCGRGVCAGPRPGASGEMPFERRPPGRRMRRPVSTPGHVSCGSCHADRGHRDFSCNSAQHLIQARPECGIAWDGPAPWRGLCDRPPRPTGASGGSESAGWRLRAAGAVAGAPEGGDSTCPTPERPDSSRAVGQGRPLSGSALGSPSSAIRCRADRGLADRETTAAKMAMAGWQASASRICPFNSPISATIGVRAASGRAPPPAEPPPTGPAVPRGAALIRSTSAPGRAPL